MRSKKELESRVAIVRDSKLGVAFSKAEKASRGKSPSAAFPLAIAIARQTEGEGESIAIAKAVRWQRILERDYPSQKNSRGMAEAWYENII